ncbi:MAG: hypothetical protein K2P70_05015 [Hyphomonadaceae bacterium]|nr:hypothetical protein [Hyphomonadaceae bacterium]
MSRSFIVVCAAVGLLAMMSSAAVADSPGVADFHQLCIDTDADAASAFAAADASGWILPQPGTIDFVPLSGNTEGRVINPGTSSFRAFSAGETISGNQTFAQCAVVAVGSFEEIAADMMRSMPVEVGPQNERQISWNYVNLDGRLRSLDHMSVQDLVRAGQSGQPQIHVIALRVQGGAVLAYSRAVYASRH